MTDRRLQDLPARAIPHSTDLAYIVVPTTPGVAGPGGTPYHTQIGNIARAFTPTTRGLLIATCTFPTVGVAAGDVSTGDTDPWPAGIVNTLASGAGDADNGGWSVQQPSGSRAIAIARTGAARYKNSLNGIWIVAKVDGAIVHEVPILWARPESSTSAENPTDLKVNANLALVVAQNVVASPLQAQYNISVLDRAYGTAGVAANTTIEFYEAGLFLVS